MHYLRIYQDERMFDAEADVYSIRGNVVHIYKDTGEDEAGGIVKMGERLETEVHVFTSVFISNTPASDS